MAVFFLLSSAFAQGGEIPVVYTCDGDDISPPLRWGRAPGGTECYALVCEDPDAPAGTWVHWVVYNIPADRTSLPEGVEAVEELEDGTLQGTNSWGRLGYGGPSPPSGTHRYYFRLYALDGLLDLPAGADAEGLRDAMEGHVLAEAELMGRYSRR
jgi:Raf kinase inhibitor-like YbhB/YbcL family protein